MTLTAAGDILESAQLVNLDVPPVLIPTSGEGAPAQLFTNEDIISPTSANVQFSTYTLGPRIPTNAKIKKVESCYATKGDRQQRHRRLLRWSSTCSSPMRLSVASPPVCR